MELEVNKEIVLLKAKKYSLLALLIDHSILMKLLFEDLLNVFTLNFLTEKQELEL